MSIYNYTMPGKKNPKPFCGYPEKKKQQEARRARASEARDAEEVWEDMQREQRREQLRRRRSRRKAQNRKQRFILVVGAVLLAGVIAVWWFCSWHGDGRML